jgi:hypothetical protein
MNPLSELEDAADSTLLLIYWLSSKMPFAMAYKSEHRWYFLDDDARCAHTSKNVLDNIRYTQREGAKIGGVLVPLDLLAERPQLDFSEL